MTIEHLTQFENCLLIAKKFIQQNYLRLSHSCLLGLSKLENQNVSGTLHLIDSDLIIAGSLNCSYGGTLQIHKGTQLIAKTLHLEGNLNTTAALGITMNSLIIENTGSIQMESSELFVKTLDVYGRLSAKNSQIKAKIKFETWGKSNLILIGKAAIKTVDTTIRGDLHIESPPVESQQPVMSLILSSNSFALRPSSKVNGDYLFIDAPQQETEGSVKIKCLNMKGKTLINYGDIEVTKDFELGFDSYLINNTSAKMTAAHIRVESTFFNFGRIDATQFSLAGLIYFNGGISETKDTQVNCLFCSAPGATLLKLTPNTWNWKAAFTLGKTWMAHRFPIGVNAINLIAMTIHITENFRGLFKRGFKSQRLHEQIAVALQIKSTLEQGWEVYNISQCPEVQGFKDQVLKEMVGLNRVKVREGISQARSSASAMYSQLPAPQDVLRKIKNLKLGEILTASDESKLPSALIETAKTLSGTYDQESLVSWQNGIHLTQNSQIHGNFIHLVMGVEVSLNHHRIKARSLFLQGYTAGSEVSLEAGRSIFMGGALTAVYGLQVRAPRALITGVTTLHHGNVRLKVERLHDEGQMRLGAQADVMIESGYYAHSGKIVSTSTEKKSAGIHVMTTTAELTGTADVGTGRYQIEQISDAQSEALLQAQDQYAGYQFSELFGITAPRHWELTQLARKSSLDIGGESIHLDVDRQTPELSLALRALKGDVVVSKPVTVKNFHARANRNVSSNQRIIANEALTVHAQNHIYLLGADLAAENVEINGKNGIDIVTRQTLYNELTQFELNDKTYNPNEAARWKAALTHLKKAQEQSLAVFNCNVKHAKKRMREWGKVAEAHLTEAQKQLLIHDPRGNDLQEALNASKNAAKAHHTGEGFPQLETAKSKVNALIDFAENYSKLESSVPPIDEGGSIHARRNIELISDSDGDIHISNATISADGTTRIQGGDIRISPGETSEKGRYEAVKKFHEVRISGGDGADNQGVGLFIMAEKKLEAKKTNFFSKSQMILGGAKGVEIDAETESHITCHKTYHKKSLKGKILAITQKKHETQMTIHPSTLMSGEKMTIFSSEGAVDLSGAQVQSDLGAVIHSKENVNLLPIVAPSVKKQTVQSHRMGTKKKSKEVIESSLPTRIITAEDTHIISERANVRSVGAELCSLFGDIVLQASNGFVLLQRMVLHAWYEERAWNLVLNFPGVNAIRARLNGESGWSAICAEWPTADSLKKLFHSNKIGEYLQNSLRFGIQFFNDFSELAHLIATGKSNYNPRLSLGLTHTHTRVAQEYLGTGSVYAGGRISRVFYAVPNDEPGQLINYPGIA